MTLAATPPIEIPLERMSLVHKFELKEALDRDLREACRSGDAAASQDWHFEVLAEREKRLASGEAHLMSLDEFTAKMRSVMP